MVIEIIEKHTDRVVISLDDVENVTHISGTHYVITSSEGRLHYTLSDDEFMVTKYGK